MDLCSMFRVLDVCAAPLQFCGAHAAACLAVGGGTACAAVSITKRMCFACAARVACDTVMIIEHVCKFASVLRPRLVRRLREGMEGAGCSSASRCYLQTLLSCPIPLTFVFFIQNVGVSYIRGTCYRGCLLLARQAPSELFTRQMKTRDWAPPN